MKIVLFFLLILPSITSAKTIELVSNFVYSNVSGVDSGNIYHRVTIPQTTKHQKVIKIDTQGLEYNIKNHKNSIESQFIEVVFNLPKQSKINKSIIFTLDINEYTFNLEGTDSLTGQDIIDKKLLKYIVPSKYIESQSNEVKAIAKIIMRNAFSVKEKVESTYEFVNDFLAFKKLPARTSALESLKSGYGDCTEYADLFVAISREMKIPARTVSLFNFSKNRAFNAPNHNEAEIYLKNHGWVIVYTNLGQGKYLNKYALGKMASDNILYKVENVWTWSNFFSKKRGLKSSIAAKVSWKVL